LTKNFRDSRLLVRTPLYRANKTVEKMTSFSFVRNKVSKRGGENTQKAKTS